MNQTHPIPTSHLTLLIWTFVLPSNHKGQHCQYNNWDICWKIWGSNLGPSKRTVFSPKHPGQLQQPPNIQLNEDQRFFCGHKVARADSMPIHIHLQASLSISGAIPPLNLYASMAHIGTFHCNSNSYLCTYNPTQLISRFACPNLRESTCSKQQNAHFIHKCTP